MKKILIFIALGIALPVYAGWTRFDSNEKATRYIDIDSAVQAPPSVRVWALLDFKQPLGNDRSMRLQYEINCKESKLRILSVEGFTGQMLTGSGGKQPGWNSPGNWEYVAPGSSSENLLTYNCRR